MNTTIQPQTMHRMKLGEIALRILENLLSRKMLCIETIKNILNATPTRKQDIPNFVARLIQRNDWFPRRSEGLALQVVLHRMEDPIHRLAIADAAAAVTGENQEEWESFMATCLRQIGEPRKVNNRKARLDDWLESI